MKVFNIILFLLFLILLSSGCHKPGLRIHGQAEAEVFEKDKIFVEGTNTSGKINNEDNTGREVAISGENLRETITSVLDAMIEAYKNKDTKNFMDYISDDFTADADILETAIQRDFSFFNNIELRYVLKTLSADSNGKIFVTLSYNRFLISTRNGESFTDRGTTAFVFHPGPEHPVVFSMKNPLIFGLSNAEEVETGTVIASGNHSAIVVDDRGNLSIEAYGTSGP